MKNQERKKRREVLRPSPNEEATILQSDKEKRKKLRLKQVREQEKAFSRKLLEDARKRKTVETKNLASHLKSQWENEQNLKRSLLERKYQQNLAEIGLAHQTASEDQTSYTKPELSEEEKHRASERYRKALDQLMYDRAKSTQSERERAEARHQALETERLRAAKIAALPPPKDPIADLYLRKGQKTREQNVDSFSTTRFHLHPSVHVERDLDPNQKDAGQVALDEEERLRMLLEDAQRNKVEQTEKARLRHKHALEMLQLEEDHKKLMEELGQLERHDRQRRQEAVAKIPVRIFQPPHKCLEDAEDRQRDLEQAFEDMYMMQTGYTGDLTVALEPVENLMTAVSEDSATSDVASDIDRRSVETDETRGAPSAVRPGRRPESGGHRSEPEKEPEEAFPRDNVPKAQTEDPLRRLLQRIERQRDQWKRRQLIEEPQPTAAASTDVPRTLPSTKPSSEDQGYRVPETIPFSTSPESLAEAELSGEEADGRDHAVDTADEPRSEGTHRPVVSETPHPPMDGIRTLLHPLEVAQRSRTTTPSERAVTHQEALLEQQKLKLKLQQQTLLQQHLEQQIQDYQRQLADIYGTTGAPAGPLPSRTLRAPDEHMPLEETFPTGAPYEGVASLEDSGPRRGQTSQALPTGVPTITSHEGSPLMSDVLESSTLSSATSNETEAVLPSEFERTLAAARATADRAAEMRQKERDVLQELSRAALEDVPFSGHTHSERDASPRSTPTLQSQELVNISTPSTLSLSVTLSSDLSVTAATSHTVTSRFSDHALHSSSQPLGIPFPNVGDTATVTAATSLLTKTSQYLGLSREPSSNIRSFPLLTSGSDVQTRFSVVSPSSVSSIRAVTESSRINPLTFATTSLSGGATAVSHSSASQLASPVYSTGYLDYYKQKIEEERQLFEAQRKRIRRYSDKFKSSSYESPGSQTYKAPVISSTNAPQSEPHLSSPFLSNLRGDDAGVLVLDQNKENQGLIANSVGIRGQDRLRDISQRLNTLEKTLTTNSSSIAVTSASYTSKPGSTSGWSYGSSTEYLSLPRNTAGRHFLGSAGSTLSSLSELTEMMTRLTSTSDESDDKSLRAGATSGPLSVISKGPLDVAHSHAPKEPSAEFSSANGPTGILSGSRWTRGSDGKPWYVLSRSNTLPSAGTLGRDAVLPEMEEEDNVFPEVTGYKSPLSGSEETGSTTSARLGRAEKLDDSSSASGVNALMSSTISSASSGSLADSPKVSDVQGDSSSLSSTGK